MLRHFLEGNTRRPAGRSTGKRRTHPRQARTHTVGVASDPPVECFAVDGGEMRADIAQKAEKSRVTDVRVLRPSERAPENGTLALTRWSTMNDQTCCNDSSSARVLFRKKPHTRDEVALFTCARHSSGAQKARVHCAPVVSVALKLPCFLSAATQSRWPRLRARFSWQTAEPMRGIFNSWLGGFAIALFRCHWWCS